MKKIIIAITIVFFIFFVSTCKFQYVSEPVYVKSNEKLSELTLILEDYVEVPVVVIGDPATEPKFITENVIVENLNINGNKSFQKNEIKNGATDGIRNSGIVIRKSKNVIIRNCTIRNCRSAGIVIEKGCENVLIENCEIFGSSFDGIACYESVNCEIRNCHIHNNEMAGLSFDLQFNNNYVHDCRISKNKVGIFIRDCTDIIILNTKILDNTEFAVYINQTNDDVSTLPSSIDLVWCENNSKNNVNKQK